MLAIGAALLLCAPAGAQRAEISQLLFDDEGLPRLVANPSPDGHRGKIVAWRICRPSTACETVPLMGGFDDHRLVPGDVPPGTTFEVDVRSDQGELTTAISPPWQGRVTAAQLPRVAGGLRVGRLVRALPATWTGGWGTEYDRHVGLEACRDPSGSRCETLMASDCAVPGRRYTGWWVRAVNSRVARDTVYSRELVVYPYPRSRPLERRSRTTVASQLVGPLLPGKGALAECYEPWIRIHARVKRTFGYPGFPRRLAFAEVRCGAGCEVALIVRDARRTIRRRFSEPGPFGTIGLPLRTRLVGRKSRVRVIVNGRHHARRTVRLTGPTGARTR